MTHITTHNLSKHLKNQTNFCKDHFPVNDYEMDILTDETELTKSLIIQLDEKAATDVLTISR